MKPRRALASGGLTATLCLACCAPPIIAALGLTAGVATLAGLFVGLTAAIAVVVLGVAAIEVRRRRRRACAVPRSTSAATVAPAARQ
jgi:hypothetical protein